MPVQLSIAGTIIAFIFGIVVGSFLNVCIYRLPLGASLSHPPSHCPRCQHRLRPWDLAPLLSFLLLRGRCRDCGTRISWRYFIIEAVTGLLFVACWWSLALHLPEELVATGGWWLLVLCAWVYVSAMLVTFMIDLDTTYVIEPVTWIAMAAGLGAELLTKTLQGHPIVFTLGGISIPYLPTAIPGMLLGFLFFIGMDLFGRLIFRKPGMGLGDAFIGAAIGAMLGPGKALLAFGIAIAVGAVLGGILMLTGTLAPSAAPGSEDHASPLQEVPDEDDQPQGRYMPFGPFLTASAVAIALAPTWFVDHALRLWYWYQHLFWS